MGLCEMCGEADATDKYVAPVCAPCKQWLTELEGDLAAMEASNPALAAAAERVTAAFDRWSSTSPSHRPVVVNESAFVDDELSEGEG